MTPSSKKVYCAWKPWLTNILRSVLCGWMDGWMLFNDRFYGRTDTSHFVPYNGMQRCDCLACSRDENGKVSARRNHAIHGFIKTRCVIFKQAHITFMWEQIPVICVSCNAIVKFWLFNLFSKWKQNLFCSTISARRHCQWSNFSWRAHQNTLSVDGYRH